MSPAPQGAFLERQARVLVNGAASSDGMAVRLLDSTDADRYRRYVNDCPQSTFYHTLEWLTVLRGTYGYRPCHLLAESEGEIRGVLPLFLVSSLFTGRKLIGLPFSHAVGWVGDDEETARALLQGADRLADQLDVGYVEIRSPVDDGLAQGLNFQTLQLNHESTLALDGSIDQVWQSMDNGSVRWGVRKARRSGVQVTQGSTLRDFRVFYELEAETRRRQGVPVYPFSLYRNIYELLLPREKCRLYLAYAGDVPIGGVVVFYHNGLAVYGYSATKADSEYLRLQPTNLLLWTAIEDAHGMGCRMFNFGSTPLSNQGLLSFKKRWGTETQPLNYSYLLKRSRSPQVIDREGWKVDLARRVLRRCPLPLTKAIGPLLVKHLA